MTCPRCQAINPEGARFCLNCGLPLAVNCPSCGTSLPPDARFCPTCGYALAGAAGGQPARVSQAAPTIQTPQDRLRQYIPPQLLAKLEAARDGTAGRAGGVQGERRIVTILFCDVRGSTALAEQLDPEEWAEIINGAFEYLITPVYRYEGTLARLMGDAILAFFGAPLAHEDDPERAVRAGLEIVAGVAGYREQVKRRWGLDLNVRVGINTGLVVVGEVGNDLRVEYTALGDAVNVASRMEQAAEPGTVQVAEPTYRSIARRFEVEPLGAIEVRGKAEPVPAYRVRRAVAGYVSTRGIEGVNSPLVGREREVRTLRGCVEELLGGRGQLVSLMGEAGLGKSRLVAELREALGAEGLLSGAVLSGAKDQPGGQSPEGGASPAVGQPALQWLEGRSLSYETMTPYAPFVVMLTACFGLTAEEGDAAKYARLSQRVAAVAPGRAVELAPYLAMLLGVAVPDEAAEPLRYLEPPQVQERIFAAVGAFFAALSTERPLVLVFEDLHWADPTSLELLERLMALADEVPLLLLAVFRPQRQEPSWRFHEAAARDYPHRYTPIALEPLDDRQSRELVVNLLQKGLQEEIGRLILARAEGNPFYVEEVIRALLDAGAIARVNAHWVATRDLDTASVPETLAGVLTARLDRLDEETRRVAQTAAVIGREFPLGLLTEVYHAGAAGNDGDGGERVAGALRELQRRELVRERGRLPERGYLFKHVLTQEAAYNSLLLSRRRALHRRVAEALERAAPERVADIARHYWEAREYARALPYLIEAGDRAARAYAPRSALEQFSRALDAAGRLGAPAPAGLHRARGQAHDTLGDFDAARADYEAALELARATGDRRAEWQALLDLGLLWAGRDYAPAGDYFQRALALARELGDPAALARSLNRLGNWHLNVEEPRAATQRHREALALFEELGDRRGLAETHDLLAMATVLHGDPQGSVPHLERALALFGELDDRRGLAASLSTRAMHAGLFEMEVPSNDPAAYATALRDGERAIAIAREIAWRAEEAFALTGLSATLHWHGEYGRALSLAREALQIAEEIGHRQWLTFAQVMLGVLHLDLFALPEGRRHLEQALALAQGTRSIYWQRIATSALVLAHIAQGDLAAAAAPLDAADPGGPVESMAHWQVRFDRAELALARGEPEAALRLADDLTAPTAEGAAPLNAVRLARLRGEALAALGRAAEAEAAFHTALEGAGSQGLPPLLWRLHAALGKLYRATGRQEDATREVMAARTIIDELATGLTDNTLRETFRRQATALLEPAASSN